jgi:hypothetical protein
MELASQGAHAPPVRGQRLGEGNNQASASQPGRCRPTCEGLVRRLGREGTQRWTPLEAIPGDLRSGQRHLRDQIVPGQCPEDVRVREVQRAEQVEQLCLYQRQLRASAGGAGTGIAQGRPRIEDELAHGSARLGQNPQQTRHHCSP